MRSCQHDRESRPSLVQPGWYGTFWVQFSDLHATGPVLRLPDESRLIAQFEKGYDREKRENRLKGVVLLNSRLPPRRQDARRGDGVETESFSDWKWGPVFYQDARHRLAGARQILPSPEWWWVVDIWVSDICIPTPGWVVQQLYLASEHGEIDKQKRLPADLSPTSHEDINRFRFTSLGPTINKLLTELAPYDGLWRPYKRWKGFTPEDARRLQLLKCREQIAHCLNHILQTWKPVIDKSDCRPQDLDGTSVQNLQGLCPGRSKHDRERVVWLFEEKRVFAHITDVSTRSLLLREILLINHLIPSLFCMLQNAKWLEGPSRVLHNLLKQAGNRGDGRSRGSLQTRFHDLHTPQTGIDVQTGDFDRFDGVDGFDWFDGFERIKGLNDREATRLAYLQMWLFAFRYFPVLDTTKSSPVRRDRGHRAYVDWERTLGDRAALNGKLHGLYRHLGYQGLGPKDPPDTTGREQLVRREGQGGGPLDRATPNAGEKLGGRQRGGTPSKPRPKLTEVESAAVADDHRYGKPHLSTFLNNRETLFLHRIYGPQDDEQTQEYLTSSDCLRDTFQSFFGFRQTLSPLLQTSLSSLHTQVPPQFAIPAEPVYV